VEKAKTILLTVLVAVSLVQSYMLGYSSPRLEPLPQGKYVESVLEGTPAELQDLVFPDQIILHYGKKSHTVLYPLPFINHYRNIFDFLKQRSFGGLRKTNVLAADVDWNHIRDNYEGIEIRFREGVPFSVLQSLMKLSREDTVLENELISRIWIYSDGASDDVKTFFISDTRSLVYEAVKADVTTSDLAVRLRLGESLPKYHTEYGEYYLPDEPVSAIKITMPYTQYTPEQLKRSLFVDPSSTRSLQERDGTQIITDSVKGLQLRNDKHWFVFSNPASAPVDSKNEIKDNLLSAVQFINQHGGWNSMYLFSQLSPRDITGPQTFTFRQYLEGYPVMNVQNDTIGYMKVVVQKGIISNYERSMIIPDTKSMAKEQVILPGGKELDAKVTAYGRRLSIVRIYPGYQPEVREKEVVYVPKWIVELRDGTYEVLE
jgi:regulatory protein YycH of two-component signal transduction system YycFG